MLRLQQNEKGTFSATLKASSQETEAALRLRRTKMDTAWDGIDEGWKDLRQRMTEAGITKPSDDANDGMVRLNVGGSHVNVRRSVLEGKRGSSSSGWALADLFQASWDKRLPMDTDGRYVLDESPISVKHLIHAALTSEGTQELGGQLIAEERAYLSFVSQALGLPDPGMVVSGGSTILGSDESGASKAALQRWFPNGMLELKYRATRDGWTEAAFHASCDASHRTITLFQVVNGAGRRHASIVGGFSGVSWSSGGRLGESVRSPGALVFMLKDDKGSGQRNEFQPVKWGIRPDSERFAVARVDGYGPVFGGEVMFYLTQPPQYFIHQADLASSKLSGSPGTLLTGSSYYNIPSGSAILELNGQQVSEIEVFSVCPVATATPQPQPALPALNQSRVPTVMPTEREDDLRNFGVSIAGSLMEERMALREAEMELLQAGAKASAAANALEAVYGPDIAAGTEDPVVELSVQGVRMTTLRSTLQICADSALATRFDEATWPAQEKDVDKDGRRVIDCSPSVFSKVLDVLRMKKRGKWTGDKGEIRVAVKAVDRESFEEFVNMHFLGCESFVFDCVAFLEETPAGGLIGWGNGTTRVQQLLDELKVFLGSPCNSTVEEATYALVGGILAGLGCRMVFSQLGINES